MARKPKKYRGKYYGKFATMEEVEEFKRSVLRRYTKTPDEKKNVPDLVTELNNQGYRVTYNTVRTWLRTSEVRVVKNPPKSEPSKITSFMMSHEVDNALKEFSGFISKSDFIRQAVNVVLGFDIPDMVIIFFREGNVILTANDEKILALTTQTLKPNDLKFLQGMVTMAQDQDDWKEFVKKYAQASGLSHYPL